MNRRLRRVSSSPLPERQIKISSQPSPLTSASVTPVFQPSAFTFDLSVMSSKTKCPLFREIFGWSLLAVNTKSGRPALLRLPAANLGQSPETCDTVVVGGPGRHTATVVEVFISQDILIGGLDDPVLK